MKFKVQSSALWVREHPSQDAKRIGVIYKNAIIESINIQGNWIYHSKGWSIIEDDQGIHLICLDNGIDNYALDVEGNVGGSSETIVIPPSGNLQGAIESGNDYIEKYININKDEEENYVIDDSEFTNYGGTNTGEYFIKDVRGIHGMPYQFMTSVDNIPSTDYKFGRKYTEKIITRMPLLLLTPGRPKFMKNFSKQSKDNVLKYIAKKDSSISSVEQLFDDNEAGKLYSFESCYADYYSFVNPMCQRMSRYLGIQDKTLEGKKLSSYEWEHYANSAFKNFISSKENIAFYIDSDTQISESFSNSTGESMLAGAVNGLSDTAREIQFILGDFAGYDIDSLGDSALETLNSWTDKFSSMLPTKLINSVKQGTKSVLNGGKMVFPEIWNDSSFSRSYRISIKLRTPDADNLSWFMNIGVPMIHLICLVAPHQLGPNGFQSPFLVRGWYKGFFNCDMGIITDMEISKGDKGRWTLDGLPTEVDISFTMKDLYQILYITSDKDKISDLLSNTAMLDYIANMCGINVYKPDLERAIDLVYMTVKNKVVDTITFNGFIGVENALSNMINSIFSKK